ncbi:MAG TPA: TolC family protein [Nitrospirota bacterium]
MKTVQAFIMFLAMSGWAASAGADGRVYTIDDAYRAALSANELVKLSEENVFQSEARIDQAWTYLYPRLIAQGEYTRFNEALPRGGGAFLFQPNEQYLASLTLTQPLYTGGRTLAALHAAQKMRETSSEDLSFIKQDMMMKVAEAYYGVLKAQKSVDISRRSLERMEHHKKTTEREAATRRSKANQSALLRANSLVSQARIALVRSQDGLKIAKEKLSLLTKLPVDAQLAEPSPLEQPADSLDSLQKAALSNRGDYASARMNKDIAEENVTIVRGAHYPQLAAVAGMQYQDSEPAIFTDATTYYAGLRLTIPIFEGGLMKAEVSEARSKVRQAELSSGFLRQSIESDVQEAYVNLQTVISVLETAKLGMDYAIGNYDAVESLFSEGLLASLSLIDAEQALTFAERELMNAGYDRELAVLRLRKSVGLLGKE